MLAESIRRVKEIDSRRHSVFSRLTANVPRNVYDMFKDKAIKKGGSVTDVINKMVIDYISKD